MTEQNNEPFVQDVSQYARERVGNNINQSDILNDVLDFTTAEKHDEFLEWAGQALGVVFYYPGPEFGKDGYNNGGYGIREREES